MHGSRQPGTVSPLFTAMRSTKAFALQGALMVTPAAKNEKQHADAVRGLDRAK